MNGKYYIRPSFFNYYYSKNSLHANIVHLGCCKGAYSNELIDSIHAAGATAVLAYSDTVYMAYDYYMSGKILEELYKGNSVETSANTAKSQFGISDLVWGANQRNNGNHNFDNLKSEDARLTVHGNGNVKIHNALENGNFDSLPKLFKTMILSWKQYGDARGIYKLSGLSPKSNPKMAIISSGFGSQNDETTSCIYQTILVPNDASKIELSYDVVSEEPMEFVGTVYNDIFQVDILSTDGTVLETLAHESVNTSEWFAVDGINFPGGDDTTFHTRWKDVSSDLIEKYRNQLVVIRAAVQDAGDAIYDTAAIIDSVTIK